MNLAILMIQGDEQGLDAMASRVDCRIDRRWRAGDVGPRGVVANDSGLVATVSDQSSSSAMMTEVREFATRCMLRHIMFKGQGLSAALSIGVSVGEERQFAAEIQFPNADLRLLADLGVSLEVCAYPTSETECQ